MPVIRKGDTVKVIAGKEKGKSGNVLEVLREEGRVRIEKLMTVKRHVRKGRNQANPEGGIVEKAGTIAISNVMVVAGDEAGPPREGGARARRQGKGPPRQAPGGQVAVSQFTASPGTEQAPAEGRGETTWQRD